MKFKDFSEGGGNRKDMAKVIETRGISKRFGGITAVNSFDFHVEEKEIVGLIGPNGAGKTTVFNLIMGVLRQDSGDIIFNGTNINNYPTHKRVKIGIARTYQIPKPLKEWTIFENIRISMIPDGIKSIRRIGGREEDIRRIAKETGLTEYLEKYPDELPIGALRRLELARALANDPKLILIDEAFAGMTKEEIDVISELLKKKRKEGMSFIIIDHNLEALANIVDRVIVIHLGRKLAEGKLQEIIKKEDVKKAYLGE